MRPVVGFVSAPDYVTRAEMLEALEAVVLEVRAVAVQVDVVNEKLDRILEGTP